MHKCVIRCWYFWIFNQSHLRSKPLRRIAAVYNQLLNADLLHQAIHQPLMKAEYGSSGEIISYLFFLVFTCPLWIQCLNFRRYLTPDRASWRVFSGYQQVPHEQYLFLWLKIFHVPWRIIKIFRKIQPHPFWQYVKDIFNFISVRFTPPSLWDILSSRSITHIMNVIRTIKIISLKRISENQQQISSSLSQDSEIPETIIELKFKLRKFHLYL